MLWLEISIILISVKPTLVINVKISHLVRFWTFSGRFCASRGKTFFRIVLNAFSVEKFDQSPITFLLLILYNFIVVIFFEMRLFAYAGILAAEARFAKKFSDSNGEFQSGMVFYADT